MSEASRRLQFRRHPHLHKASVTLFNISITDIKTGFQVVREVDNHHHLNFAIMLASEY